MGIRSLACLSLLSILSFHGAQGQVISEPVNVITCEGQGATFTCVLNSNIRSDDVQWYRFIEDNSTTVMVDPNRVNINFLTTNGSTTSSSLTITNARKSYTGYYWVRTSSGDVCNASLIVLARPPALTVNVVKNIKDLSIVLQWDEVDDSLHTTYTIHWGNRLDQHAIAEEVTSYTITGLTLDTVYTIAVSAVNTCGQGPEFRTTITFSPDTTSTTSIISPTVTASTTTMTIISTTANPGSSTTTIVLTSTDITTTLIHFPIAVTTTTGMSSSSTKVATTISRYIDTTTETGVTSTANPVTTATITGTISTTSTSFTDVSTPTPTTSSMFATATANPADTTKANEACTCDEDSGLPTVAVAVIAIVVTFILTLIVTAVITFIVAYVCVKRTFHKAYDLTEQPPAQEKALYEQVCLPSQIVTKNDLELQPNPAYGTRHKVIMDTNPAYESCKYINK